MANNHQSYMRKALALAERNLGCTAPNPSVGCVIVKNDQIIAEGITKMGGRPHAETIALEKAGSNARGADLYVTLEPCSHHGKTPPCAESIVKAGIKRVFIANIDPSEKVLGKGIKTLKDAGIRVETGIMEDQASKINEGFFSVCNRGRPFVTLKLATSLDGKIATSKKESKWITNDLARKYAHMLRAKSDAIVTGIGTVLQDDPDMTCRIAGLEGRSPVRIVLDSKLRIDKKSKILQNADKAPTWIITSEKCNGDIKGATIIKNKENNEGSIDLASMLKMLADKDITTVMVECGSRLATSFIKSGLVDRIIWVKAPILIGNDGIAAIGNLGLNKLEDKIRLILEDSFRLEDNIVEIYKA